jgi:hypothetical protein
LRIDRGRYWRLRRWSDQNSQLVDDLGGQESAVRFGSAFDHEVRDAKIPDSERCSGT